MPVMDGKTQIGEFSYQLPVSYVKPKLKLSKTSATIKKGSEQTVDTVVLEKKSNGLFEAIDISNQEEGTYWTAKKGSAVVALGDEAGQLFITASDATNGSIVIKQENWAEAVELKFSVKAKATDVLSASAKKLVMNTNAAEGGAEQSVTILLNNKEITEESNVTVTMPKGWESANIDVEGIEEGKLVSSEVKFSYKESAPKKGNYTFKFAAGKAKVSVKLSVSDAALADKAVSLKVKTKLDLVSGQKMVLEPIRKNIAGEISDVALDETSAALFDIEYNDEVDQIYIMAKDVTKLDTKTKYNFTVSMNVGGKACSFTLKNQKLAAKKPSVKLSKATMPKANVTAGTAVATVNVLSTSKLGGKIFTVAPLEVSFNGTQQDDGTWQISDKKGTATVSYNAEEGTITIVSGANASGKMPAIKATLKYNGGVEIKNKTISIKVK